MPGRTYIGSPDRDAFTFSTFSTEGSTVEVRAEAGDVVVSLAETIQEYLLKGNEEIQLLLSNAADVFNIGDLTGMTISKNTIRVSGRDGDDEIDGSTTTDRRIEADGGVGSDTLTGDSLSGGPGNDILSGLGGADVLDGGDDTDTADYSDSPAGVTVFLDGTAGSGSDAAGDVLTEIENLTGSAFNDILFGDGASNTVTGGAGIDFLQGGAGADVLDGGADFDWVSYADAPGPLAIDLATPANSSAFFAEDKLVDIQGIVGASDFANTITGSATADVLDGGGQADTIDGGAGNEVMVGEGGNDTMFGGIGSDAILGNTRNDELWGGTDTDVDGFYFNDNDGDDVIKGFDLANDVFVFISSVFNAIADLSFGTDVNGHGVIIYGGASITVEGVTEAELQDEGLYFWF